MSLVNRVAAVLSILMIIEGYMDCCTSQPKCRCFSNYSLNNIYADCSNLGLIWSPYFWSNVTEIDLSQNALTELPNRTMLPDDITYLDLSYNSISTFKNNSFKGLSKLSVLKMNSNSFRMTENLDISLFADLINIKYLDLSDNNELTFQILPILTHGLQNSTIASLWLNKIHCTFGLGTKIRIKDVRYLKHTNLTELHLSSNRIELVENGVLDFFPKTLKRISIADNQLTFGIYALELRSLKGLEWLNGSAQYLTHDPAKFIHHLISQCENEREYLTRTHIYKQKNRNLKGLQKSFPNDVITGIPMPQNIKTVFFNDSGIRFKIPEISFSENSLEEIYLQNNILSTLEGPLKGLESLRILNLSNNFCSTVKKTFFQFLGNLSELYLRNNLLGFSLSPDAEGQIFANLKRLIRLDLKTNRISNLPIQVFKNLENLKDLDLADNALGEIRFTIANLKQLQFLDLSGNQIQFLSDTNMNDFDRQSNKVKLSLNLLNNPIMCTCKTLTFLRWMVKNHETEKINFKSFKNYSCTTSSHSSPLKFSKIKEHIKKLEKECSRYTHLIITVTIFIVFFLCILLSGLLYRYRWKLRYFYYMTKSRYHGYKSVRSERQSDFIYDAFVSYAEEDMPFVQKMVSELEINNRIRLCIHSRDFVPGYDISENIITAINKSRKTVVILSPNFIKSSWCMYELHIAKMEEIYSRENEGVLLLIFYDVVPVDKIPLSIMDLIKQKSYIEFPDDEYGDPLFWKKVSETLNDEIL